MNRTGSNKPAALSSNPTLAAIQRAKAEAAACGNSRGSLEQARSADQQLLTTAVCSGSPGKGSLISTNPAIFKEEQAKKLADENEASMLREGWWAKTDAGNMNIVDEEKEKKNTNSYVPQGLPAGFATSNALKFDRMLTAPAGTEAVDSIAAVPTSQNPAIVSAAPVAVPQPASATHEDAPVVTLTDSMSTLTTAEASESDSTVPAPVQKDGDFNWWDKMDNKVLNEKDAEVPKFVQSSFQPQFMGSGLVNKLDFSRRADDSV